MKSDSNINNSGSIVELRLMKIAPFTSVGNTLYMVIGSDNITAETAFYKFVSDYKTLIYKGLTLYQGGILANYDFSDNNYTVESRLESLGKDKIFYIPSGYNFEKQYAVKPAGSPVLKNTEVDAVTYLRYCVSRLGNPKYYLLFKIDKAAYKASDFYRNHIAGNQRLQTD